MQLSIRQCKLISELISEAEIAASKKYYAMLEDFDEKYPLEKRDALDFSGDEERELAEAKYLLRMAESRMDELEKLKTDFDETRLTL